MPHRESPLDNVEQQRKAILKFPYPLHLGIYAKFDLTNEHIIAVCITLI